MSTGKSIFEVDARGMRCPWPALRAARALRTHPVILLRADDPVAAKELASMSAEQGWLFEICKENLFLIDRRADPA